MKNEKISLHRGGSAIKAVRDKYITCRNMSEKGFTMVELIVVLVIVAILAAVVVPLMAGYIDSANDEKEIEKAEASLAATQAILTEAYNDGSNRVTPSKRDQAKMESGADEDSYFTVWTVSNLNDGDTPATSDNIGSYTVAYAEYRTSVDGKYVVYDGKNWTLYENSTAAGSNVAYSNKNDQNAIYMWPRGVEGRSNDSAYHPSYNARTEDENYTGWTEEPTTGAPGAFSVVFLGYTGSGDNKTQLVTLDGRESMTFDFDENGFVGSPENMNPEPVSKAYKEDTFKWELKYGAATITVDKTSYGALETLLLENYEALAEQGESIVLTPYMAHQTITVPLLFTGYSGSLSVENGSVEYEYDLVDGAFTGAVSAPEISVISQMPGDDTRLEADRIATFDGKWLIGAYADTSDDTSDTEDQDITGSENEESNVLINYETDEAGKYVKIDQSALFVKEAWETRIKGYAESFAALYLEPAQGIVSTTADTVVFAAAADIHKSVYLNKILRQNYYDRNKGDEVKEELNSFSFHKNEVENEIYVDSDTNEANPIDPSAESIGFAMVEPTYDWGTTEGTLNPNKKNKLKYWDIYNCDKDGNDILTDNEKERIKDHVKFETEFTKNVLGRLYSDESEDIYGVSADASIGYLLSMIMTNETSSTQTQYTGGQNYSPLRSANPTNLENNGVFAKLANGNMANILSVNFLGEEEGRGAYYGSKFREMCISVTRLQTDSEYVLTQVDGEYQNVVDGNGEKIIDDDYPNYIVAYSVPNGNKYDIYVFTEDGGDMKAIGTLQSVFRDCTNMKVNTFVEHLETSEAERMKEMFMNCSALERLNLQSFDIRRVTDTTDMFRNCTTLNYNSNLLFTIGNDIDFAGFNMKNTRFPKDMFNNCAQLTTLPALNLSSAYNIQGMFAGCTNLNSVILFANPENECNLGKPNSNTNYSGSTALLGAFAGCGSLDTIEIRGFRTSASANIDSLNNLFNWSGKYIDTYSNELRGVLEKICINNCAFPALKSTNSLFKNYSKLRYVDLGGNQIFDSDNLKYIDASYMFQGCTSLRSDDAAIEGKEHKLDLSSLHPNKTEYMFDMYDAGGSEGITTADVGDLDTTHVTSFKYMFRYNTGLQSTGDDGLYIDCATSLEGLFSGCSSLATVVLLGSGKDITNCPLGDWASSNIFAGTRIENLTFKDITFVGFNKGDNNSTGFRQIISNAIAQTCSVASTVDDTEDTSNVSTLQKVVFDDVAAPNVRTAYQLFLNATSLTYVDLSGLSLGSDETPFNNAVQMFEGCTSLTGETDDAINRFDISGLGLADSTVTINMQSMFRNCENLTNVHPSGLSTIMASNMSYMFKGCSELVNTGDIGVRIDNTTTIANIFEGCIKLTEAVFDGGWDGESGTSAPLTTVSNIFNDCALVNTVTVRNLYSSSLGSLSAFFRGTNSTNPDGNVKATLTTATVSNVKLPSIKSLESMFDSYGALTNVSITDSTFGTLTSLKKMFYGCAQLTGSADTFDITGLGLDALTSTVSMESMFQGCKALTSMSPNGLDTHKAWSMRWMFGGCDNEAFTGVSEDGLYINSATNLESLFNGCSNLTDVILKGTGKDSTSCPLGDSASTNIFNGTKIKNLTFKDITFTGFNKGDNNSSGLRQILSSAIAQVRSESGTGEEIKTLQKVVFDDVAAPNVRTTYQWFLNATSLTYVDLSGLSLGNDTLPYNYAAQMFKGCSSLKFSSIIGLDTSSVVNFNSAFYGCTSFGTDDELVRVCISKGDDVREMFRNCSNMKELVMYGNSDLDKTEVKINNYVKKNDTYTGCDSLTTLTYENLKLVSLNSDNNGFNKLMGGNEIRRKLKHVTFRNIISTKKVSFAYMFSDCPELISATVENVQPQTDMQYMFDGCVKLTTINMDVDTSNVTNMLRMFNRCYSLEEVDVSKFDTSKVTDFGFMFNSCFKLEWLDLSNFDTSKGTNFESMFNSCYELEELELSNFDTSKGTNFKNMFGTSTAYNGSNTSKLTTIYASEDFVTNNETTVMFGDGLTRLVGGIGTRFNDIKSSETANYYKSKFAWIDGRTTDARTDQRGYFTKYSYAKFKKMQNDWVSSFGFEASTSDLTGFQRCTNKSTYESAAGIAKTIADPSYSDPSGKKIQIYGWIDSDNVFNWYSEATTVYIHDDTKGMFNFYYDGKRHNTNLKWVDFQGIDTSLMKSYESFFGAAVKLERIYDKSKGSDVDYTFRCSEKCNSMKSIFDSCNLLESVDLSGCNTEKVTNMTNMFMDCASIIKIDLRSFSSESLTDFVGVFYMRPNKTYDKNGHSGLNVAENNSLEEILFSPEFSCSKVTSMKYLFGYCKNLTTLDLSMFDASKNSSTTSLNVDNMFEGCSGLERIYVSDPTETDGKSFYHGGSNSRMGGGANMFKDCSSLVGGDGSTLSNSSNSTNATYARIGIINTQKGYFTKKE